MLSCGESQARLHDGYTGFGTGTLEQPRSAIAKAFFFGHPILLKPPLLATTRHKDIRKHNALHQLERSNLLQGDPATTWPPRVTMNVFTKGTVSESDEVRRSISKGVLLVPISLLAREKKTWSPVLLSGVLWRAFTNMVTVRDVYRLLKLSPFADAAKKNSRFGFKYLTHDYLARSMTVKERASCFLHHYRRMYAALPDQVLREILIGDVVLHEIVLAENLFTVTLGLSRDYDKEGEFSIKLLVNREAVFVLSFTLVPGWVIQSDSTELFLISRIQGITRCYPKIQLATKALHEVAPGALLLAALQGIAIPFAVGQIAAVTAKNQSSYSEEHDASFTGAYDEFFAELGIAANNSGFYVSSVPIPEKPLALIKKGHKIRTKKKRAFKEEIMMVSASFFRDDD